MERGDYFSLSFFGRITGALRFCGTHSGRDVDKAAAAGLTRFDAPAPYYEQCSIAVICRKIYYQDIDLRFHRFHHQSHYQQKDYHRMYVGEVVKFKKDE